MTTSTQTYRGWAIAYDPPPIPVRACDWCATHPDYDGADGIPAIYGGSPSDLRAQIDDWFAEQTA